MAVQRRDDQLRCLLEPGQRLVGVQAEVVLEVGIRVLEHPDIGAGAEELLAGAAEHDDVDVPASMRASSTAASISLHHLVE